MKRTLLYGLIVVCIQFFSCTTTVHVTSEPAVATPPPPAGVSYQTFYDELSPYGHWINNPDYGYVWMPDTDPGFRPYATNGHWVYSDEGWTWASDYPWGWAAFHYGRWFYEDGYGWMWVPGHEWAPAWVSWRRGDDVYGWAPLSPGTSVSASFSNYDPPANYWCFVPHQYVTSPSVNNYYVDQSRNLTIIKNTTIINNTTVNNYGAGSTTNINSNNNNNSNNRNNNNTSNSNNSNSNNGNNSNNRPVYTAGPAKNEVEQATNTHIQPVTIRNGDRPGSAQAGNGQLVVYRPRVAPVTTNVQNKPAPLRIESLRAMKPVLPAGNTPVAGATPSQSNANTVPARRDPPQNQAQPVQHTDNTPVTRHDADKPATIKTNDTETPVKKDQPANAIQPDKTISKPPVNTAPVVIKNSPAVNTNTVPSNQPDKTANKPVTNPPVVKSIPPANNTNTTPANVPNKMPVPVNRANTGNPGNPNTDNRMNQHRLDSVKKTIKPIPPAKTDGDKKKDDGGDKKKE